MRTMNPKMDVRIREIGNRKDTRNIKMLIRVQSNVRQTNRKRMKMKISRKVEKQKRIVDNSTRKK